jgi:hypothetical protein
MATSLLLPRVLWLRRRLRRHERWNQAQLSAHQQRATAGLRQFAYERSPFYRRFHHGLESAPLAELPVLTKAVLMDLQHDVTAALRAAGATVPGVRVRVVDTIPAGAAGKRPLVVAWHAYRAGTGPAVPS